SDGAAEPWPLLDKLEIRRGRIEAPDQDQRNDESNHRRPERHPTRVARTGFVLGQESDEQRPAERKKQQEERNRQAGHQCGPANMNQVIAAATPISMAKA